MLTSTNFCLNLLGFNLFEKPKVGRPFTEFGKCVMMLMLNFPKLSVPQLMEQFFCEVNHHIPRYILKGQWGLYKKENPKWSSFYTKFRKMVYRCKQRLKSIAGKISKYLTELCLIDTELFYKIISFFHIKPIITTINHVETNKENHYSCIDLVIDFFSDIFGYLGRGYRSLFIKYHIGGCGKYVKTRHYALDLPWSMFGVETSCRAFLSDNEFINFDCSSAPEHNTRPHKPHVEFSSINLLVKALWARLQGFTGEPLWQKLGVKKVSTYGGRGHVTFSFWRDGIEYVESCSKNLGLRVVSG